MWSRLNAPSNKTYYTCGRYQCISKSTHNRLQNDGALTIETRMLNSKDTTAPCDVSDNSHSTPIPPSFHPPFHIPSPHSIPFHPHSTPLLSPFHPYSIFQFHSTHIPPPFPPHSTPFDSMSRHLLHIVKYGFGIKISSISIIVNKRFVASSYELGRVHALSPSLPRVRNGTLASFTFDRTEEVDD